MHPRISIIIPTFNEADEIGRAVASALQAREVEVLVVDGLYFREKTQVKKTISST